MSIDSLLRPFKLADRKIYGGYDYLANRLNIADGRRKYGFAFLFNTGFNVLKTPFAVGLGGKPLDNALWWYLGFWDLVGCNMGLLFGPNDKSLKYLNIFPKLIRLPSFAAGVGLVGKSAFDFASSAITGSPIDPMAGKYLEGGIGFLCLASSAYLKEAVPDKKKTPDVLTTSAYQGPSAP